MPDKVDISIEISQYELVMGRYYSWRYPVILCLLFLYIPGLIWFIIRLRKKRKLMKKYQELIQKVNDISGEITVDEFILFKKRLAMAKTPYEYKLV